MFNDGQLSVFKKYLEHQREDLNQLRKLAEAWGQHKDWPWNGFILSHATIGGSKNWDDTIAPLYQSHFSWDSLKAVKDMERNKRFEGLGNPRYRKRVAIWAEQNFNRIDEYGGPQRARELYEGLGTASDRIAWIKSFAGFGDKYGRNIPMDRYDELVIDHFAIDHRLMKIIRALGHQGKSYDETEHVFKILAVNLNTNAWELDRVIYGNVEKILAELSCSNSN